jgi:hypothetical protein
MLFFDMTKLGTIDLCSTSAEKHFFGNLAMWKSNFSLHLSKDLNFRPTSKKFKGGSPKKILEKKNVFPKMYVELRTFDGSRHVTPLDEEAYGTGPAVVPYRLWCYGLSKYNAV